MKTSAWLLKKGGSMGGENLETKPRDENTSEVGIVIIESLMPDDKKTGQILLDETLKYLKFKMPDLLTEIHQVRGSKKFEEVMHSFYKRASKEGFLPIIQIETHGSNDGIQLSSGETIPWKKFFSLTRKINIATKNSLVVHLALCEGGSLLGKFEPDERAPFKAVIASFEKIYESDMLNAYQIFYENLFTSGSHVQAIELMNKEVKGDKPSFHLMKSEHMFDAMLDENRDPAFFDQMVNDHAVIQKTSNPNFKKMSLEIVKMKVRKRILKMYEKSRGNRDFFVMKDLM